MAVKKDVIENSMGCINRNYVPLFEKAIGLVVKEVQEIPEGLEGIVFSILQTSGPWYWEQFRNEVGRHLEYTLTDNKLLGVVNSLIHKGLVQLAVKNGEFLVLEAVKEET